MEPEVKKVYDFAKTETFTRLELARINSMIPLVDESHEQQEANEQKYEAYDCEPEDGEEAWELEETLMCAADEWNKARFAMYRARRGLESALYQLEQLKKAENS